VPLLVLLSRSLRVKKSQIRKLRFPNYDKMRFFVSEVSPSRCSGLLLLYTSGILRSGDVMCCSASSVSPDRPDSGADTVTGPIWEGHSLSAQPNCTPNKPAPFALSKIVSIQIPSAAGGISRTNNLDRDTQQAPSLPRQPLNSYITRPLQSASLSLIV
jgi:hypothetical protein